MADETVSLVVQVRDLASRVFDTMAQRARDAGDVVQTTMRRAQRAVEDFQSGRLARQAGVTFNAAAQRFVDDSGRFISRASAEALAAARRNATESGSLFDRMAARARQAIAEIRGTGSLGGGARSAAPGLSGAPRAPGTGAPVSIPAGRRITGTTAELQQEVRDSIEAFAQLRRSIDVTDRAAVRAFREAARAEREWMAQLGPNVRGVQALERELRAVERLISRPVHARIFDGIRQGAQATMGVLSRVRQAVFSLHTLIIGAVAGGVIRRTMEANIEFERLTTQLNALTGGVEQGTQAFTALQELAIELPSELRDVVEAYNVLVGNGLSPTRREILALSNVAVAMGRSLLDTSEAISSAVAGEFEPIRRLLRGSQWHKEGNEIKVTFDGVTRTIKANAKEITAVLVSLGETKWGDASAKQMETLGGAVSNLKDALWKLAVAVGQSGLSEWTATALRRLTDYITALAQNQPRIRQFTTYVGDSFRVIVASVEAVWARLRRFALNAENLLNSIQNPIAANLPGTAANRTRTRLEGAITTADQRVAQTERQLQAATTQRDTRRRALESEAKLVDYLIAQRKRLDAIVADPKASEQAVANAKRALEQIEPLFKKYNLGKGTELPTLPVRLPSPEEVDRAKEAAKADKEALAALEQRLQLYRAVLALNPAESTAMFAAMERDLTRALAEANLTLQQRLELERQLAEVRRERRENLDKGPIGRAADETVRRTQERVLGPQAPTPEEIGRTVEGSIDVKDIGQVAGEITRANEEMERLQQTIDSITQDSFQAFGGAIEAAMSALVTGSQSAGQAFAGAILGAIAQAARALGAAFMANAAAALASTWGIPPLIPPNPKGPATAAKWALAGAGMYAVAGLVGGLAQAAGGGGGGGGGGGSIGSFRSRDDAIRESSRRDSVTVEWVGDHFDPRDPQQLARFQKMREEVGDRRMVIRAGRGKRSRG